jgi:hypothetical protein
VKTIGKTLAEIDGQMHYLNRPFCILELYETVVSNAELLCYPCVLAKGAKLREMLAERPVDAEAATTRNPEDKGLIDDFIRTTTGFERVNMSATA